MQGNAKSMVLSMIACIAGCLVLLALIPRQGATQYPTVQDVAVAHQVSASKKWDVAVAKGLGAPWRAVNARLIDGEPSAGRTTRWQAGYQGSGDDYVAVQQTKNGGENWFKEMAGGSEAGTVHAAGATWRKMELSSGGQKALIRSTPLSGLDTIVTGKGSWEQLVKVAAAATPASMTK